MGGDYSLTLLLHGMGDTNVPYHLAISMRDWLTAVGVERKLITIESDGHGFDEQW